jgi:hypothetical protein
VDYYIGLGDSISISSYPSIDAHMGVNEPVGAVDLTGKELIQRHVVRNYFNMAVDGEEIDGVYTQLSKLPDIRNKANIITLTIGGNDISFSAMKRRGVAGSEDYPKYMARIKKHYNWLIEHIFREFPNSLIILNSLYDPTDGTGELPNCGQWSYIAEQYSHGRRELGDHIRTLFAGDLKWNRVLFCDVFQAFDGHGMKSGNIRNTGYYYKDFLIEPGHIGAQVVSDLWLNAITEFVASAPKAASAVSFSR